MIFAMIAKAAINAPISIISQITPATEGDSKQSGTANEIASGV